MTALHTRIGLTALGLTVTGLGVTAWNSQADAAGNYHDSAFGISASGAAPIGATPSVSSTQGSKRTAAAAASSSDSSISVNSASVSAGGGKASATVDGFTAFDGLVHASTVTATCDNGTVSSHTTGVFGSLGQKGSIAYGVKNRNSDGSMTIIGMQVRLTAGINTAASTINIASVTCAHVSSRPIEPDPTPTSTLRQPTPTPTVTQHQPGPQPTETSVGPRTPTSQGGPNGDVGPAPVPTPHTTHLSVTG